MPFRVEISLLAIVSWFEFRFRHETKRNERISRLNRVKGDRYPTLFSHRVYDVFSTRVSIAKEQKRGKKREKGKGRNLDALMDEWMLRRGIV